MYNTIQTIDAYLNSKHIYGSTDALGREKPFFNIVTAATNIWYRATDIDRKDIQITASCSPEVTTAFVASIHLKEWMYRERFGVFLNLWGRTMARYGSAVVKFVKKDGRLIPSVVSWSRLLVDPIDFYASPIIEKIYLKPSELRKRKEYNQEMVEALLEGKQTRETLEGENRDQKDDFIELYEVHGEFPLSFLTSNDKDKDTYRQQMHVITFTKGNNNEFNNYSFYKGKEEKSPYMLTHLIEEEGRTLAIGAVEYLFDAQWMVNHTIKHQRDYLDLASKLIFQTSDQNFVGRNVLSAIETGDVLILQPNQTLTQVNNNVGNISALMNFGNQWVNLSREITSTPDAMRGNTMPSGTPYSLGAMLGQQAGSLFELMTENKGLAIEDMLREFVIPFLKSKMDTSEEIVATLDEQGIKQLDQMYVPREAIRRFNKRAVSKVLNGELLSPYNSSVEEGEVQQELSMLGNVRFFKPDEIETKTWKEVLKDLEWKVKVQVTNEIQDKQVVLQTLSTVLQSIASNPAILQDPNAKMLFSKILSVTGAVSPLELVSAQQPPVQSVSPQMGQVDTGRKLLANVK